MKKIVLSLLVLASLPSLAQGGGSSFSDRYGRCVDGDLLKIENREKKENKAALRRNLQLGQSCNLLAAKDYVVAHPDFSSEQVDELAKPVAQQLLTYVEQNRQDKQVGASDTSVGTTSLVSKGVGAIVGIALESGSIDRTSSGNVTTVTLNAAQAAKFLSAGGFKRCELADKKCNFGRKLLTGLTVSTTYDISKANTSTNSTAAEAALSSLVGSDNPAFTGVSARLDFNAQKKDVSLDVLAKAYAGEGYLTSAASFASTQNDLITRVEADTEYQQARDAAVSELQRTDTVKSDDEVNVVLDDLVKKIATVINKNPQYIDSMKKYLSADQAYHGKRDEALGLVLNKWTASFEYDFQRLTNQPDQSTFTFIYSYRSDRENNDRILQVTANAGTTIYDTLEGSATSRVRSAKGAFQLDYTATSTPSKVQAVVSGGYYFQYMVANGLLSLPATDLAPGTAIPLPGNASELLNTTGPIHIGQGKVTLSVKNSNIRIPLALTFSNRTDLIKASRVGANFGITYDFSSLFAAIKN